MVYFKSFEHFECYVNKAIRNTSIDISQLLPIETYAHYLSDYNLVDAFGAAIRTSPELLQEDNFWDWLGRHRLGLFTVPDTVKLILHQDFIDRLGTLRNVPGVYSFWNVRKVPLYVGMSKDLSSRPLASFTERFRYYVDQLYFRYFSTTTMSDAALFEVACIAKLKPALNTTGKFGDELTVGLDIPNFMKPIKCNIPGEKVGWEKDPSVTILKDTTRAHQ